MKKKISERNKKTRIKPMWFGLVRENENGKNEKLD